MADSIDGLVKMSLPMREAPPIERRDEVKMQKTEETRVQSYDSTMTAFENEALAAAHEVPAEPDEVGEVLAASEPLWAKLKAKLHASPCGEAARKLISNHEAVLRDVTNPAPVSQMDVPRVPVAQAKHVDQALREIARRLLRTKEMQERLVIADGEQLGAWAQTAKFLDARIQSQPHERPGRAPDLSPAAASEMRAVAQEVWWATWAVARQSQAKPGARLVY